MHVLELKSNKNYNISSNLINTKNDNINGHCTKTTSNLRQRNKAKDRDYKITAAALAVNICPKWNKVYKSTSKGESAPFKKHLIICKGDIKNTRLNKIRSIDPSVDLNELDDYDNNNSPYNNNAYENFMSNISEDINDVAPDPFDFNDDLNMAFDDQDKQTNDIKNQMTHGNFHIIHININSLFNKIEHVFEFINDTNVDIVSLNEIKLDNNIPSESFEHPNYKLIRRSRTGNGGGIMVYVKKVYQVSEINLV